MTNGSKNNSHQNTSPDQSVGVFLCLFCNMKRFFPWLIVFGAVLVMVPLFVWTGDDVSAKILGVVLVVILSIALNIWRIQTKTKRTRPQRMPLNANHLFWLKKNIPFYNVLSKSDQKVFQDRIGLFLAQVDVVEVGKEDERDWQTALLVASGAVMAYWGLDFWNYGKLREVIVYPDNYNEEMVISERGNVMGQVHHGGMLSRTMILSKRSLLHGFRVESDKLNVGVHEFAHLLDKADGYMDGIPVGMSKDLVRRWVKLMEDEMEEIQKGKSDIRDYAATDNAEFFASLVEYYKESPSILKRKHPEIFDVLDAYFNNGEGQITPH